MAPAWARYIHIHAPALGDAVEHRDLPIREAVRQVQESTGCPLDCGHEPLDQEVATAFIVAAGCDSDKARLVVEWAPYLVPELTSA